MLFQFGNTAKFFVGDKAVDFESGDVLVFKTRPRTTRRCAASGAHSPRPSRKLRS